jgi:6-phosphogluconolactonase/glucosamine-6-phosphate isomerase/deaminase
MICENYQEMSRQAARFIAQRILSKPNLVLALPTGNTPLGFYRELVRMFKEGLIDFSKATVFNLDEYSGFTSTASTELSKLYAEIFLGSRKFAARILSYSFKFT